MKGAWWSFLGALLTALSFSCCPPVDPSKVIARIDDATVSLVDEDGDMYCAGVWVAQDEILTAAHCVEDLGMTEEQKSLQALLTSDPAWCRELDHCPDIPKWDPVGQTAWWKVRSDPSGEPLRHGVLVRWEKRADLALVKVQTKVEHAVVRVRKEPVRVGEPLHIVGHPINRLWGYTHGFVSDPAATFRTIPGTWLQVDTAIHHGDSGGGAFDSDGLLAGIGSFGSSRSPGLGWFVPQQTIREFLLR